MKYTAPVALLVGALLSCHGVTRVDRRPHTPRSGRPALVLWITVDQLRGDVPGRFEARLEPGGFRRLIDRGVWYTDAHYRHATTLTATGHATLLTGAGPAGHGMAGNVWADRESGEHVYCVEDARHRRLDAAEATAHAGTSPALLEGTTVGDELVLASGARSRVFSVSIKDRGAILPGGKLGKAFWYSKVTGGFTSSSYYYDELPDWAQRWADEAGALSLERIEWRLSRERDEYTFGGADDRACERPPEGMGRVFPHVLEGEQRAKLLANTPMGDALTVDFALALLEAEDLGQASATDLLAVSLSSTDYIGHAFGPFSLEAEDNVLRLDSSLARLLEGVDERVGLENTLVVFSSDHGVAASPEHVNGLAPGGDCGAGRHVNDELLAGVEAAAREELGVPGGEPWIRSFWTPSVYLDLEAVAASGAELERVERALARAFEAHPGIVTALTRSDLERGVIPQDALSRRLARSFHRERSGQVLITAASNWYLYHSKDQDAAMHGTAHAYDAHVPILVAGPGVTPRRVARRVAPSDLAATVSALLRLAPPSASEGRVLGEVLE